MRSRPPQTDATCFKMHSVRAFTKCALKHDHVMLVVEFFMVVSIYLLSSLSLFFCFLQSYLFHYQKSADMGTYIKINVKKCMGA